MSSEKLWGDAYYSEKSKTRDVKYWSTLLLTKEPHLKEEVERSFKQWNLQIRDHLRNETALRLTAGTDTSQVQVKIVDGFPEPMAIIIEEYKELSVLLLHKNTLEETDKGLTVIAQHFEALVQFVPADFGMENLIVLREWLDRVIGELKKKDISKTLGLINVDILGAYYFNQGHVEIYWMAIGIVAVLQGIPVTALTAVVLARSHPKTKHKNQTRS